MRIKAGKTGEYSLFTHLRLVFPQKQKTYNHRFYAKNAYNEDGMNKFTLLRAGIEISPSKIYLIKETFTDFGKDDKLLYCFTVLNKRRMLYPGVISASLFTRF